jgi:serine/threonine protein kinase
MGRVLRASDTQRSGKQVAVKIAGSRPGEPLEEEAVRRFKREVRVHRDKLAGHPNIIGFHEAHLDESPPLLAMELAMRNLRSRILPRPIDPYEGARIFEAVRRGVVFAHDKGVVHRDLKPENVLQAASGVWKVSDFGLCLDMDRPLENAGRQLLVAAVSRRCGVPGGPERIAIRLRPPAAFVLTYTF